MVNLCPDCSYVKIFEARPGHRYATNADRLYDDLWTVLPKKSNNCCMECFGFGHRRMIVSCGDCGKCAIYCEDPWDGIFFGMQCMIKNRGGKVISMQNRSCSRPAQKRAKVADPDAGEGGLEPCHLKTEIAKLNTLRYVTIGSTYIHQKWASFFAQNLYNAQLGVQPK